MTEVMLDSPAETAAALTGVRLGWAILPKGTVLGACTYCHYSAVFQIVDTAAATAQLEMSMMESLLLAAAAARCSHIVQLLDTWGPTKIWGGLSSGQWKTIYEAKRIAHERDAAEAKSQRPKKSRGRSRRRGTGSQGPGATSRRGVPGRDRRAPAGPSKKNR